MIVTPIKTHILTEKDNSLIAVIDKYITSLPDRSVVAISSNIVSICEGRIVEGDKETRDALIPEEAQWYIPRELNKYSFCYTITRNTLIASAGIDQSNADNKLTLWPNDPQKTVNKVREFLCKKFKLKYVGVIITDSRLQPFRWGVTGICLAHSGFRALNDYRGKLDLFGRPFIMEQASVVECLATTTVLVMGEGAEQTPLATATDLPFVQFQDRNPTQEELDALLISPEEDVFWPLLKNGPWKKGKKVNPKNK